MFHEHEEYEQADTEAGDPGHGDALQKVVVPIRPGRRPLVTTFQSADYARLGMKAARGNSKANIRLAEIAASHPGLAKQVHAVTDVRRASLPVGLYFCRQHGFKGFSASIGTDAKLGPWDARAVANTIVQNPGVFEPKVFTVPVVGSNYQIDIDSSLDAANGGPLATGDLFDWLGGYLKIVASSLNYLGVEVSVVVTFGGRTMTISGTLARDERTGEPSARVDFINGILLGGKPKAQVRRVTVAPAATGTARIVVSGVPTTGFSVQLRHFIPGDEQTDAKLALFT